MMRLIHYFLIFCIRNLLILSILGFVSFFVSVCIYKNSTIIQGFLSDDTTLAGALWRNLYMQRSVDPVHLNRAVYYVRGTVCFNCK